MKKVVIDSDIPFIKGVLEPFLNVTYIKGVEFSNINIKEADALIVRTRTKCNDNLLCGTNVKFIATATIGVDHIDKEYCSNSGIEVVNAAGCNAGGVMQYVFSAIFNLVNVGKFNLRAIENCTIGIIGCGNVGKRVAQFASYLGFNVIGYDPYIPDNNKVNYINYCTLDTLLQRADIVTIHTSLTESSRGMVNSQFLSKIKEGALLINAARGEVVVDRDLIEFRDRLSALVIDVWNGEPSINLDLLNIADIATPHIAGYSLQGKINATVSSVVSIAKFFGIEELVNFNLDNLGQMSLFDKTLLTYKEIINFFIENYCIFEDDKSLRLNPLLFEDLRNKYNYREEFYYVNR